MKKVFNVIGYIFMILGLVSMLVYTHILKSSNGVTYDLLDLKIPETPSWITYIPAGGLLGWIYELFSLHGIVSILIFLFPAYIGGLFLSKEFDA